MNNHWSTLPSTNSAERALSGDTSGWVRMARDLVVRAGLIAGGMYDRNAEKLAQRALAGSAAIELFVFAWIMAHKLVVPPQT